MQRCIGKVRLLGVGEVELGKYERSLCERAIQLLEYLTEPGRQVLDDIVTLVQCMSDDAMAPDTRQDTYNGLVSIRRLLGQASARGAGNPKKGRAYDLVVAVAVTELVERFGLDPGRSGASEGACACSVLQEELAKLMPAAVGGFIEPPTYDEVLAGYNRGRKERDFAFARAAALRRHFPAHPLVWMESGISPHRKPEVSRRLRECLRACSLAGQLDGLDRPEWEFLGGTLAVLTEKRGEETTLTDLGKRILERLEGPPEPVLGLAEGPPESA
jgi:hypothetical protein